MPTPVNSKASIMLVMFPIKFGLNYFKYMLLTATVIIPVAMILISTMLINPNTSFEWMKYLSFIDPRYKSTSYSMSTGDIMKIFYTTSLIFMAIVNLFKFVVKKLWNIELTISLKTRLSVIYSVIILIYTVVLLCSYLKGMDSDFDFIYLSFFVVNVFSATIYLCLDYLYSKLTRLIDSLLASSV